MARVPAPSPAKPAATRNDVARLARVSPAVVSYVVNRSKRVSPETEARVRQAIAMLGYRPNSAARSLRLGSTETLGMLVPDTTNSYFATLAHQVELAAIHRGRDLIVGNSDGSLEAERRLLDHFTARRVDGVLLCSSVFRPDISSLRADNIPVVLLNHAADAPGVAWIGADLRLGARLAVEHLAGHGHRRIGLVIGTTTDDVQDARHAGWSEAIDTLGLERGPVVSVGFNSRGGYEAGRQLLADGDVPPALFVSSDRQAIGLLLAMHEAGVRVPDDVAIVGFDGAEDGEYSWPPLTTVAQPIEQMARTAVDLMIDGAGDDVNQVFPPTLLVRRSCGC
jgi:LacI family transcriptional regulator